MNDAVMIDVWIGAGLFGLGLTVSAWFFVALIVLGVLGVFAHVAQERRR